MPLIVVFDLGGVLARINHSWQAAAKEAGVEISLPTSEPTSFVLLDEFNTYQAGEIAIDPYLHALSALLECSVADALAVHNAILRFEYEGVSELISELHDRGIATGCLSNTNAAHWTELVETGRFPSIAQLQIPMASHLVGLNKPDVRIFQAYCDAANILPADVVYFDDARENVAAAAAMGLRAHWIDASRETVPQLRAILSNEGVL